MGQDPSRLDRQITANREHIAATLDALAYKANLPARIVEQKDVLLGDAVGLVDSIAGRLNVASQATARALPPPATRAVRSVAPLITALLTGMLIGLTWPKRAQP